MSIQSGTKLHRNKSLVQPTSCEHAPPVQSKRGQDAPSSQLRIKPVIQGVAGDTDSECEQQEHLQTFAERLRAKLVRECVRDVKKLQRRHVYIGRGASHFGYARSMWANPFQTKRFGLEGALARFDKMLHDSPNLLSKLDQLHDKVLLCHCANNEPCHGDNLIKAWEKKFLDIKEMELKQEPPGTEELFRAAECRS